jgi:hypothetical protein
VKKTGNLLQDLYANATCTSIENEIYDNPTTTEQVMVKSDNGVLGLTDGKETSYAYGIYSNWELSDAECEKANFDYRVDFTSGGYIYLILETASIQENDEKRRKLAESMKRSEYLLRDLIFSGYTYLHKKRKKTVQIDKLNEFQFLTDEDKKVLAKNREQNLINEFLDEADKIMPNTDKMFLVTGFFIILSALYSDKAVIPMKHANLTLNLYMAILGESSTYKSTVANNIFKIIKALRTDIKYATKPTTTAGLEKRMQEAEGKIILLKHDEFADFFNTTKNLKYMSGVIGVLLEAYIGTYSPQELKNSTITDISKVRFVWLACGVGSKLIHTLSKDSLGDGLFERFLIVYKKDVLSRQRINYFEKGGSQSATDDVFEAKLNKLVDKMRNHYNTFSRATSLYMSVDDDAVDLVNDFMYDYMEWGYKVGGTLEAGAVRFRDSIFKCMGLLSLYKGKTQISRLTVLEVLEYASKWHKYMIDLHEDITSNVFSLDTDEVFKYIERFEEVSMSDLYRKFKDLVYKNNNARYLQALLQTLQMQEKIMCYQKGSRMFYKDASLTQEEISVKGGNK